MNKLYFIKVGNSSAYVVAKTIGEAEEIFYREMANKEKVQPAGFVGDSSKFARENYNITSMEFISDKIYI